MWMLSSDNGFVDVPLIAKNGGMLIAARVFYLKQVPVHPLTNTSLSPSLLRLRPVLRQPPCGIRLADNTVECRPGGVLERLLPEPGGRILDQR
jgi:hypothetical protein